MATVFVAEHHFHEYGVVPNPADEGDEGRRAQMNRMLEYMGLTAGQAMYHYLSGFTAKARHATNLAIRVCDSCLMPIHALLSIAGTHPRRADLDAP